MLGVLEVLGVLAIFTALLILITLAFSWLYFINNGIGFSCYVKGWKLYLVDFATMPLCQAINFRFVPLRFQVLFTNFVVFLTGIFQSYVVFSDLSSDETQRKNHGWCVTSLK